MAAPRARILYLIPEDGVAIWNMPLLILAAAAILAIIPGVIFPQSLAAKLVATAAGILIGAAFLWLSYPGRKENLCAVVTEKALERRGPTGIAFFCPLEIIEAIGSVRMPDGNHVIGIHIKPGEEARITVLNRGLTQESVKTYRALYDADVILEGNGLGQSAESVRRYIQGAVSREIELRQMVHQTEMDYQARRETMRLEKRVQDARKKPAGPRP